MKLKQNNYILSKLETKSDFDYLVLPTHYITLDEYVFDLEMDLRKKKFTGKIIIDLLPINGIKDRFYSLIFDGHKFIYNSISNLRYIDSSIECYSSNFYLNHFEIIESLTISNQSKFLIKKMLKDKVNHSVKLA